MEYLPSTKEGKFYKDIVFMNRETNQSKMDEAND